MVRYILGGGALYASAMAAVAYSYVWLWGTLGLAFFALLAAHERWPTKVSVLEKRVKELEEKDAEYARGRSWEEARARSRRT